MNNTSRREKQRTTSEKMYPRLRSTDARDEADFISEVVRTAERLYREAPEGSSQERERREVWIELANREALDIAPLVNNKRTAQRLYMGAPLMSAAEKIYKDRWSFLILTEEVS